MSQYQTVLKARLSLAVQHPRAVPALLEALAMWQGTAVHAAVVVDGKDNSSAARIKLGWLSDFVGEPLYKLTFVDGRRHHHDPLEGARSVPRPATARDVRGGTMTDAAQHARICRPFYVEDCELSSELGVHHDDVPDGE